MKFKKIFSFFSLFAISLMMFSCIEDVDQARVYNDVPQIEFNFLNPSIPGTRIVRSNVASTITERVNLIAPHFSVDQTLRFTVDPELTTAVAGVHYNLGAGTFVIPANSSFGELSVDIIQGSVPAGTFVTLTLMLEGNDVIKPATKYKRRAVRINP